MSSDVQIFLTVLAIGLVIAFIILIALVHTMRGYIASEKTAERDAAPAPHAPAAVPPAAAGTSRQNFAPAPETGASGEVVAAIAAAVYAFYGVSTDRIVSVRRAERVSPVRSAWGMAGLLENTRPF